jgi:DNA-binding MarR family transcriptional regulator
VSVPFYNAKSCTLDRSIGFQIHTLSSHLDERLEPMLKAAAGITLTQWHVLATLQSRNAETAAALSDTLSHDSGAMTRMIDKLEDLCLLERHASAKDRRAYTLKMTKKGAAACAKGFDVARGNLNDFLRDFTQEEGETLLALLQKMKQTSSALGSAT